MASDRTTLEDSALTSAIVFAIITVIIIVTVASMMGRREGDVCLECTLRTAEVSTVTADRRGLCPGPARVCCCLLPGEGFSSLLIWEPGPLPLSVTVSPGSDPENGPKSHRYLTMTSPELSALPTQNTTTDPASAPQGSLLETRLPGPPWTPESEFAF